jgi:hypothetical protein
MISRWYLQDGKAVQQQHNSGKSISTCECRHGVTAGRGSSGSYGGGQADRGRGSSAAAIEAHQRLSACVQTMPPGFSARCMASKKGYAFGGGGVCVGGGASEASNLESRRRHTRGSRHRSEPAGRLQLQSATAATTGTPPPLYLSLPAQRPSQFPPYPQRCSCRLDTYRCCCQPAQSCSHQPKLAPHPRSRVATPSTPAPSGTAPPRGPLGLMSPPQSGRSSPPLRPAQT